MNAWIKELLNNLDEKLEENKRIAIMKACGEKCPFTHLSDERLLDITLPSARWNFADMERLRVCMT